jgi:RNA-directed DNA polymerase
MLMRLGIAEKRVVLSTTNGRGPWWNAGAAYMNQALPKKLFDRLGLISLMESYHQLNHHP